MKRSILLSIFCSCLLSSLAFAQTDTDLDGMPDSWENAHNLDANNAKDAWQDADEDHILNLFEYLLQSDPEDMATPTTINVTAGENLEEVLDNAEEGVVLRIQEGSYPVFFNHYNDDGDLRLMLQGGWNSDFSEYDPCIYSTKLEEANGLEMLNVLAKGVNAHLILEGLQFQHSQGVSAGIDFTLENGKGAFVLNNCEFTHSVYDGISGAVDVTVNENGIADCWIVNTLFADNSATGMEVKARNGGYARARIYHSTFFDNKNETSSLVGGGLEAIAADSGWLELEVVNSIFYENEDPDIKMFGYSAGIVGMEIRNSIVATSELLGDAYFFEESNVSSTDPAFVNPTAGDFSLQANSPAIAVGLGIGLFGSSPNIGFYNCSAINTAVHQPAALNGQVQIFPNPAHDHIMLEFELKEASSVEIRLLNIHGQTEKNWPQLHLPSGAHSFSFELPRLSAGTYILQMDIEGEILNRKMWVQ